MLKVVAYRPNGDTSFFSSFLDVFLSFLRSKGNLLMLTSNVFIVRVLIRYNSSRSSLLTHSIKFILTVVFGYDMRK